MFVELKSLLESRNLVLTVAAVNADIIRVTVNPKAKDGNEKTDKLEPFFIEAPSEELDKDFATAIAEYSNSARTLDEVLAEIKANTDEAIKHAKAEASGKVDAAKKSAAGKTAAKPVPPAKKPEPGKPEPKEEEPAAPGLFDAAPPIEAEADPATAPETTADAVIETATQENPVEGRTEPFVEIVHVTGENTATTEDQSTTDEEAEVWH